MTQLKTVTEIQKKAELIATILKSGADCEIRRSKDGVSVHKVNREKVG